MSVHSKIAPIHSAIVAKFYDEWYNSNRKKEKSRPFGAVMI